MERTEFLKLNKPQYVDPADILRINESMDIIDAWAEAIDAELANKVNKGAPQQYDLPLTNNHVVADGYDCVYQKTQNGLVVVFLAVGMEGGGPLGAASHVVATMPEGFMPPGGRHTLGYTVAASGGSGVVSPCTLYIAPNGYIGAYVQSNTDTMLFGTLLFYAD